MKEYRNDARVTCYDRHAWNIYIYIHIYIYFNYSISLVGTCVGVTVKVDSSAEA
jgi:hypothetical protein